MDALKTSIAPLAGALICAHLSAPISAIAGVYEAICEGDNQCTVTMGAGRLTMPGLAIDKEKILSWSQGGSGSKTDVGMGVGSVILFGLPGIIGFGAKKHDYQFFVNYLDGQANTQLATIKFKNNTPANQFMMEMMGMTGLSVGEVNKTLQAQIDTLKAEAAEKNVSTVSNVVSRSKTTNAAGAHILMLIPARKHGRKNIPIWQKKKRQDSMRLINNNPQGNSPK